MKKAVKKIPCGVSLNPLLFTWGETAHLTVVSLTRWVAWWGSKTSHLLRLADLPSGNIHYSCLFCVASSHFSQSIALGLYSGWAVKLGSNKATKTWRGSTGSRATSWAVKSATLLPLASKEFHPPCCILQWVVGTPLDNQIASSRAKIPSLFFFLSNFLLGLAILFPCM